MRILLVRCGQVGEPQELPEFPSEVAGAPSNTVDVHDVPVKPNRRDLAFIDSVAAEVLPKDTAPTPEDIGKQKRVEELGAPELSPQKPSEPVRVVVVGPDASLSCVVTHLMRRNLAWVEVAHVPGGPTPSTRNWDTGNGLTLQEAFTRPVRPVPLVRDDTGAAVVGYALLTEPGITGPSSTAGLEGEIWVDEHCLFSGKAHGIQVRPLPDAPGLIAAEVPPPAPSDDRGWLAKKLRPAETPDPNEGLTDASGNPRTMHQPLTGRAAQAGGPGFRYVRDGIESKKPREKVTFYRHLRDLQLVR